MSFVFYVFLRHRYTWKHVRTVWIIRAAVPPSHMLYHERLFILSKTIYKYFVGWKWLQNGIIHWLFLYCGTFRFSQFALAFYFCSWFFAMKIWAFMWFRHLTQLSFLQIFSLSFAFMLTNYFLIQGRNI